MTRIAPYAEQHRATDGPGDARPTAIQIIEDQGLVASPSWTDRVVLITGCSLGGLGPETAKAIHLTGADVFITARDVAKGKQVADKIFADGKPGKVDVIQMDLGSLESIRAGVDEFLRKSGNKLNVLINNAGHFYLFHMLKGALLASASPSFKSRVVSVASGAHRSAAINFDDLHFERREYSPLGAYAQSKLANIHFANELNRRYQSQNLHAVSVHPGGIITPLARYLPSTQHLKDDPEIWKTMKNPAQGAATTVWAAVAKELEGKGGIYLDEVAEAEPSTPDTPYYAGGYSAAAFDPPTETRLWTESLRLTGLSEQ